tara:strand:- start:3 stop:446 length:444 start_codon:yes stop_codon:yes gene_type:complete
MNSDTVFKEGNHDDFINYLYSNAPKDAGEVKLELPLNEPGKNLGLHEFEQLLMIFVDGLKYFYGENGKVDINKLTKEDIQRVNRYFLSMNYEVHLDIFPTMNDYIFKYPNYFKDQKHITNSTELKDYYYEVYGKDNCVFRIYFNKLV